MYNKLFARILYSSIWTAAYPTRIVWIAMIAAMDEDGIVHAATPRNLAALAGVTLDEAEDALRVLEEPDASSSNPDHDGRRVERFPGGWIVLNAKIYRDLATRHLIRERTAARVRSHRQNKAKRLSSNGSVTQSVSVSEEEHDRSAPSADRVRASFDRFWSVYPRKVAKAAAWKAWSALKPSEALVETIVRAVAAHARCEAWQQNGGQYVPHAATWLRGRRWEDAITSSVPTAPGADDLRARTVSVITARQSLLRGATGGDR